MIDPEEAKAGECQQCGLPLPDGGKLCAACGNKMTVLIQEWDSSPLADESDRKEETRP